MIRLVRDLASFCVVVIEVLLVFRFVLKLLGADTRSSVVVWVYSITSSFLSPFTAAFPSAGVRSGYVLEFNTLFAIFVYAFIGFVIQQVLTLLAGRRS